MKSARLRGDLWLGAEEEIPGAPERRQSPHRWAGWRGRSWPQPSLCHALQPAAPKAVAAASTANSSRSALSCTLTPSANSHFGELLLVNCKSGWQLWNDEGSLPSKEYADWARGDPSNMPIQKITWNEFNLRSLEGILCSLTQGRPHSSGKATYGIHLLFFLSHVPVTLKSKSQNWFNVKDDTCTATILSFLHKLDVGGISIKLSW